MKVLVIGGGNMGLTFAQGMTNSYLLDDKIFIYEINPDKKQELKKLNVFHVVEDLDPVLPKADVVLIAIKPNNKETLFEQIKGKLNSNQVVLSIMAGVQIASIQEGLDIKKVVRAMPNLPAKVKEGATCFTAADEISKKELIFVEKLLKTTGVSMYVENENFIDASTAISGSGPAYVFYFMQAMVEAALQMGFSKDESVRLVNQTFIGALELYTHNNISLQEWIERVSSKGGTTEAAIKYMNQQQVNTEIIGACQAALTRSIELGKE